MILGMKRTAGVEESTPVLDFNKLGKRDRHGSLVGLLC
jgi:hypothetical protein